MYFAFSKTYPSWKNDFTSFRDGPIIFQLLLSPAAQPNNSFPLQSLTIGRHNDVSVLAETKESFGFIRFASAWSGGGGIVSCCAEEGRGAGARLYPSLVSLMLLTSPISGPAGAGEKQRRISRQHIRFWRGRAASSSARPLEVVRPQNDGLLQASQLYLWGIAAVIRAGVDLDFDLGVDL